MGSASLERVLPEILPTCGRQNDGFEARPPRVRVTRPLSPLSWRTPVPISRTLHGLRPIPVNVRLDNSDEYRWSKYILASARGTRILAGLARCDGVRSPAFSYRLLGSHPRHSGPSAEGDLTRVGPAPLGLGGAPGPWPLGNNDPSTNKAAVFEVGQRGVYVVQRILSEAHVDAALGV